MNKYILPTLVAGIMLLGIGAAITSVEQASAVHTTVQANAARHFVLTGTVTPEAAATDEEARWAIAQPFELISASAKITTDANADCNVNGVNIRTNIMPEAGIAELDPAVINLVGDVRNLIGGGAGDAHNYIGTTTLAIALADEGASCEAADTYTLTAIIKTTGALTAAPTATNGDLSGAGANGLAND